MVVFLRHGVFKIGKLVSSKNLPLRLYATKAEKKKGIDRKVGPKIDSKAESLTAKGKMDLSTHKHIDFDHIEKFLLKFTGGDISLSKKYFDEGIALICIKNEKKRNSIGGKMMVDFRKCIMELENWKEGKAVILCGDGVLFSSGGDLDFAKATGTPEEGYYMSCWMHDVLKRFRNLPLISFSLVDGFALGGGSEIAVYSDYVIVTDKTKIGFVHGKMGIITAWGGGTRLARKVGERKALEILCSSKVYTAEECLNLGLADKLISAAEKEAEALAFVRQFTTNHYSITRSFNQVVKDGTDKSFEEALESEKNEFYPKWGSQLNREALLHVMKRIKNNDNSNNKNITQ